MCVHAFAVHREVLLDLAEWMLWCAPNGMAKVAQVRNIGHCRVDSRVQGGRGEEDPTALAAAGNGDAVDINEVELLNCIDQQRRVGEHSSVVVRVPAAYAAGHESWHGASGSMWVGSVATRASPGALPSRVHQYMGVAGGGPPQMLAGNTASTTISDEFNDRGKFSLLAGAGDPSADSLTAEAGEGQIFDEISVIAVMAGLSVA